MNFTFFFKENEKKIPKTFINLKIIAPIVAAILHRTQAPAVVIHATETPEATKTIHMIIIPIQNSSVIVTIIKEANFQIHRITLNIRKLSKKILISLESYDNYNNSASSSYRHSNYGNNDQIYNRSYSQNQQQSGGSGGYNSQQSYIGSNAPSYQNQMSAPDRQNSSSSASFNSSVASDYYNKNNSNYRNYQQSNSSQTRNSSGSGSMTKYKLGGQEKDEHRVSPSSSSSRYNSNVNNYPESSKIVLIIF